MSINCDQITYKKLVIVKQLYQNAVILSHSEFNIINKILSVVGFDLSIETALKAAFGSLESSKNPSETFQGLIQQVDRLCLDNKIDQIPDKANIQHIHSIRNDAQHKAKYPNEFEVSDCRTYTRDFLISFF